MQTNFSAAQLADPEIARADAILRACVHCGFCTATCPTYVLTGNELDSPRGRIYLIKSMLEDDGQAGPAVVEHLDRCLTCLSCVTTCPADVDYGGLADLARRRIEDRRSRPAGERLLRWCLGAVLSRPALFRLGLILARIVSPVSWLLRGPMRDAVELAARQKAEPSSLSGGVLLPAEGPTRKRVALLAGCVQSVLGGHINDATVRLLTRLGCEVAVPPNAGCCGALAKQLGDRSSEIGRAKRNIVAWSEELEARGLDAIVVNASGCGTAVKDYGDLFEGDPQWSDRAAKIAALAVDVTELVAELGIEGTGKIDGLLVACHLPCSLQHGQGIRAEPLSLLRGAGFDARPIPQGHLCCGSAGAYGLLQPGFSSRLREMTLSNIDSMKPDVIATGNIGCLTQLAGADSAPVVHTVELLDWATGGPVPKAMKSMSLG